MKKTLLASLLVSLPAVAQVSSVVASNTQAIIKYTAPSTAACTVEVSEDPSYSPLVHDVDTTIFSGSNLDSRTGSLGAGTTARTIVVGKRAAEQGADSHWYSRALQMVTMHYVRLTCAGPTVYTTSFSTANIPLGSTFNDPLSADPTAVGGKFTYSGRYANPEFLNWGDPASSTNYRESLIDPKTGAFIKRFTLPQQFLASYNDQTFTGASAVSSNWTNVANALATTTSFATYSGSTQEPLFLNNSTYGPNVSNASNLESIQFNAKAWCSGTCTGNDLVMQVCITLNGVDCWPNNSNWYDVTIGTAAQPTTFSQYPVSPIANNSPYPWTPAGWPPLVAPEMRHRQGGSAAVAVDNTGLVTLNVAAISAGGTQLFMQQWDVGGEMTIGTSTCTILSTENARTRHIDLSSCSPALTTPIAATNWSEGNFGFLVRKKGSGTSSLNIHAAKFTTGNTGQYSWPSGGAPKITSRFQTTNTVTGHNGYHVVIGNTGQIYWMDATNGDAWWIGRFGAATGTGVDAITGMQSPSTAPFLNPSGANEEYYGQSTDQYPATVKGFNPSPYTITTGVNDSLQVKISSVTLQTITLTAGTRTAAQIVSNINATLTNATASTYTVGGQTFVQILTTNGGNSTHIQIMPAGTAQTPLGMDTSDFQGGHTVAAHCSMSTTNQPGSLVSTCQNLSPTSAGADIKSLVTEFTAGQATPFDPDQFVGGFNVFAVQHSKLYFVLTRASQDTMGWLAVFDPATSGTTAGCAGAHVPGLPGCIVAARPSWTDSSCRWCTVHSFVYFSDDDVMNWTQKYLGAGTAQNGTVWLPGGGFYNIHMLSANGGAASLTTTPALAPGSGGCPSGEPYGCDTLVIDGEPCNESPVGPTTGQPGDPVGNCTKNSAWSYLQDLQVGDILVTPFSNTGTPSTTHLGTGEWVKVVGKTDSAHIMIGRGAHNTAPHTIALPQGASEQCTAADDPAFAGGYLWQFLTDPYGTSGTQGKLFSLDHASFNSGSYAAGDENGSASSVSGGLGYLLCDDGSSCANTFPNKFTALGPSFAGATGQSISNGATEEHPNKNTTQNWFGDHRNMQGPGNQLFTNISGDLYRTRSTALDLDNLQGVGSTINGTATTVGSGSTTAVTLVSGDHFDATNYLVGSANGKILQLDVNSNGSFDCSGTASSATATTVTISTNCGTHGSAINYRALTNNSGIKVYRKILPTFQFCGNQAAVDVSGPSSSITGGSSDAFKVCWARKAGECVSGSWTGDIYMNCPFAWPRTQTAILDTPGCNGSSPENALTSDMCVGTPGTYTNKSIQYQYPPTAGTYTLDPTGLYGRQLTDWLVHYRYLNINANDQGTPDGAWAMTEMENFGMEYGIGTMKIPPLPALDSVDRTTFVPATINLTAPTGIGVANALIQFGYDEYGQPTDFNCTLRGESCYVKDSTVQTVPFSFPSDGTSGTLATLAGASCASNCSIAIPTISQRVVYWRPIYRDSSNSIVQTGATQVLLQDPGPGNAPTPGTQPSITTSGVKSSGVVR